MLANTKFCRRCSVSKIHNGGRNLERGGLYRSNLRFDADYFLKPESGYVCPSPSFPTSHPYFFTWCCCVEWHFVPYFASPPSTRPIRRLMDLDGSLLFES